jgi:hypothetical protein
MCRSWIGKIIAISITIAGCFNSDAAQILQGNGTDSTTFSFPVKQHLIGVLGQSIFMGAAPHSTPKDYALCAAGRAEKKFIPIISEQATVNNVSGQPSPLYNTGIAHLALFEHFSGINVIERPIAVTTTDLTRVHVLDNIPHAIIYSSDPLHDVNAKPTSGIVALATTNPTSDNDKYITISFAAVKNNAGDDFGAVGSGVAVMTFIKTATKETIKGEEKQHDSLQFGQLNAFPSDTPTDLIQASPLDITSSAVKIGSNLASLGTIIDLHWSSELGCLYVGLQATANSNSDDGARAVVVGKFRPNTSQLVFQQIVDNNVFVNGASNEIVGALGPNSQTSIYKVRTMRTSTRLCYLVMLGGNATTSDTTRRTIYALPLIINPQSIFDQGRLASRNAIPEDTFGGERADFLQARLFKQPATTNADIFTSTDAAAMVGGGQVPAGTVSDMFVLPDAVYAAVGDPDTHKLPGIFASYALFDALGRIKGWTSWQRVGGSTDKIFGALLDPARGDFITMVGPSENTLMTIKRTLWSEGSADGLADLSSTLAQQFPLAIAGIQGLAQFAPTTPGLGGVSWLVATGLEKITIIETGAVINDTLIPHAGNFSENQQLGTNGTLTQIPPDAKMVTVSGGALKDLGPITCAEIASSPTNSYLAVGGVNGLALLTHPTGAGWHTKTGIGAGFVNLSADMHFVLVGSYQFVRKLISDQHFLYVLTDTSLDRIDLAASNFATRSLVSVCVAKAADIVGAQGSFLDLIISQKLALLATSIGLYRVGNGGNIASPTLKGPADVVWTPVTLPQSLPSISSMFPLTITGHSADLTKGPGGMVYLVGSDMGNNRSRLTRISVDNLTETHTIDDRSVCTINDLFIKNSPAYFVHLGDFRPIIATQGPIRFITNDRESTTEATALLFPAYMTTGISLATASAQSVLPSRGETKPQKIVRLIPSVASGSWLLAGDVGLLVHE